MTVFPKTLEEAIAQAKEATKIAINEGNQRVQIELVIPEIGLQAQNLALEFSELFEDRSTLKLLFADTGAAALARRDWGEVPFKVDDLGSRLTAIEKKVALEDEAFLLVAPSAVEVEKVEKLCNLAGDRPVVLLIPQLEDVAIVGIGYAARQIRDRFINTLETAYYLRPLEEVAVLRTYPSLWQIWWEKEEEYELVAEEPKKPVGEELDRIIARITNPSDGEENSTTTPKPKKRGLFDSLQKFLKALSQ